MENSGNVHENSDGSGNTDNITTNSFSGSDTDGRRNSCEGEMFSEYEKIANINSADHVFLARQVRTGKTCVLKELRVYDRQVYEILMREEPPGVPKIYEIAEKSGRLLVAEEYVSGITLENYEERFGCLSNEQVRMVLLSLCKTLDQLHHRENPIIHRDIKPSNVMLQMKIPLCEDNLGIESVWLIDFNTAREFHEDEKRDTRLMGTIGFAAPEQFGFRQSSTRTDIYGLGALANYMLCGKTIQEQACGETDGVFGKIIRKATQMEPDLRYASVREIAEELNGLTEEKEEPGVEAPTVRIHDGRTAVRKHHAGQNTAGETKIPEKGMEKEPGEKQKENTWKEPEKKLKEISGGKPEEGLNPPEWRSFLPPGFRTGKLWKQLIGGFYYFICFFYLAAIRTKLTGGADLGVLGFLWLILCALIWGNYRNVWNRLPFMKYMAGRIVGFIVYPLLLLFLMVYGVIIFAVLF